MKLQGFSVIFVLIIVPFVLILSFFIQAQVDTIALQTSYDTKLLDATYDAMSAFELNTSNEDLSSVSDSLRSIIQASNNIFINTFATNLGMSNASKSYVEPYLPGILYTLYDGYYIYSPTNTPEVLSDVHGVVVTVGETKNTSTGEEFFSTPGLDYDGTYYTYNEAEEIAEDIKEENALKNFTPYNPESPNFHRLPTNIDSIKEDFGQILYKRKDPLTGGDNYTPNLNDEHIVYKSDYVLKSYNPYTARYVRDEADDKKDIDITVNYTLDNFITVQGMIGNIYYAKSGYLIKPDRVTDIVVTDASGSYDLTTYNESDAEEIIKTGQYTVSLKIDGKEISFTPSGQSYSTLKSELSKIKDDIAQLEYKKKTNPGDFASGSANEINLNNLKQTYKDYTYIMQNMNAVVYYVKSHIFSKWVYDNLGEITQGNTKQEVLEGYEYVSTLTKETSGDSTSFIKIFDPTDTTKIFDETENPEDETSIFNLHKYDVIKNSIQYNLNLAMSTYNASAGADYDFNMPVIEEEEWNRILSNISITTFMQGFKCGLKTYNNYAIVSSTNNELTCQIDELFYVERDNFNNEDAVYHKIDCPNFEFDETKKYTSFTTKEVKYDRIYDKTISSDFYKYDHKNMACYTCGIDGNYEPKTTDASGSTRYGSAYYMGIGAQRQNLYKMNAVVTNEGIETIEATGASNRGMKEIKKIEVTFGHILCADYTQNVVGFKINNAHFVDQTYVLNTNQTKEQTITIIVRGTSDTAVGWDTIKGGIAIEGVSDVTVDILKNAIKGVKVIYE